MTSARPNHRDEPGAAPPETAPLRTARPDAAAEGEGTGAERGRPEAAKPESARPDAAAEGDETGIAAERARPEGEANGNGAESQGDLVELLRHNAVELLAGVPRPPRSLRLRAGAVSVDVEWADEPAPPVAAPPVAPTDPAPPAAPVAPAVAGNGRGVHYLTAPTVGTFYRASQPGATPFVAEGDTVAVRQQLGIVEAMKVMIPVEADVDGRVVEVLKGDGESVEYGERLFALAVEPAPEAT